MSAYPVQVDEVDPTSISAVIVLLNPRQVASFDSVRVEDEIKLSAAALGGKQPMDNSIPGNSAT